MVWLSSRFIGCAANYCPTLTGATNVISSGANVTKLHPIAAARYETSHLRWYGCNTQPGIATYLAAHVHQLPKAAIESIPATFVGFYRVART